MSGPLIPYRNPSDDRREPPAWLAIVLCLPATICWCALIGIWAGFHPPLWLSHLVVALAWPLVIAAIVTGIASVLIYCWGLHRRLHWYVIVNVAINVPLMVLICAAVVFG